MVSSACPYRLAPLPNLFENTVFLVFEESVTDDAIYYNDLAASSPVGTDRLFTNRDDLTNKSTKNRTFH